MIGQSGIAVKNVKRADAASVAELSKYGVATIHEAMAGWACWPHSCGRFIQGQSLRYGGDNFAHPGDNWMLHVAAELLQTGDIAVLGTSSDNADGMFGDLLATSFRARGAIGLVIDAGCRDTADLRGMQFPVWARAVHGKGTVKATVVQ